MDKQSRWAGWDACQPASGHEKLRNELRQQMNILPPFSPNEVEVNEVGLVTYPMIAVLAKVLRKDTSGEPPHWQSVRSDDHLTHCINHLFSYIEYGEVENLEHAYCRLAMAVHVIYS